MSVLWKKAPSSSCVTWIVKIVCLCLALVGTLTAAGCRGSGAVETNQQVSAMRAEVYRKLIHAQRLADWGRYKESSEELDRVIHGEDINDYEKGMILHFRGRIHETAARYGQALEVYQAALEHVTAPSQDAGMIRQSIVELAVTQFPHVEALAIIESTVDDTEYAHPVVILYYADTLAGTGRYGKAKNYAEQAIRGLQAEPFVLERERLIVVHRTLDRFSRQAEMASVIPGLQETYAMLEKNYNKIHAGCPCGRLGMGFSRRHPGFEGFVEFEYSVTKEGRPQSFSIIESDAREVFASYFNDRFSEMDCAPALRNGKPVPVDNRRRRLVFESRGSPDRAGVNN